MFLSSHGLKFLILAGVLMTNTGLARHIFLNGVDIGNLRNETLENVTVTIAPNGDLFVIAKQYQAVESSDFIPVDAAPRARLTPSNTGKFESHSKNEGSLAVPIEENKDANLKPKQMSEETKKYLLKKNKAQIK